jgi:hypothetical protein
MSGNAEALSLLAPLFKAGDPCPILLLGAGASFRSGVPTAADAVRHIARLVYSEHVLRGSRPPERVKPTEWEPWLQAFPWFIHGADRLAENFPIVVQNLLTPAEYRKKVILELMQPRNGLSAGYGVVADFVMRGLVRTILTTNFDPCLPDALRARQPHIRHIYEVHRGPGDFDQFNVFNKSQIVWLHGRAEQYSDQNAVGETDTLDRDLLDRIKPLLASPLVVIGYRGSELSVMEGLFGQEKPGRLDFPNGVYWCLRHGESLHPHVEALQRRLGSNFKLLRIDGFDELMGELGSELAGQDSYVAGVSSPAVGGTLPAFDERLIEGTSLADLDLDLTLSTMRKYCEKLKRAVATSDTLLQLLLELGFVEAGESGRVSAGALLLFGKEPQRHFPHAVVTVTEAGKKREVYEGNLMTQHRQLLGKLESPEVNPALKVKKRRQHEERPAYPPRALVELVVNLLVHRDYESSDPATIEIIPGREVVLTNPGGLTIKLAGAVAIEGDGRFILSQGVTDQRNPSLCDIFFGISAMERAGTGLMDVVRLMTEHGGGSAFYHHAGEARFEARIAQPPASAGSKSVARSDIPTGMYVLNVLPFSVLPEALSLVELKMPWKERPRGIDFSECGPLVPVGSTLWSFTPLPALTALLGSMIDEEACTTVAREEAEASPDSRRILSWLLRNHWEQHLKRLEDKGLTKEEGRRKHRAYFEAKNRGPRTVVWNSPQRSGNRRDVVKRRREGARGWFENEGVGYEIVDIGGLWCIRIKPFYMFTGNDGRTPLPSFARAAKATSRVKFDRNKNVEADMLFWSSFLGGGGETINIGGRHVDDLILDSAFLTVEVPEIGLDSDESSDQDRMSA